MEIILDISANTTNNDNKYFKKMLDALKKVDTGKHKIIIKTQIFKKAGSNVSISKEHFDYMYNYSKKLGYKCTASVFDKESLDFLLTYDVPFIKIANNKELYWLIDEVPRKIPVYVSYDNKGYLADYEQYLPMCCISVYPAKKKQYDVAYRTLSTVSLFSPEYYSPKWISDHTEGLELVKEYKPLIWEKHYKLKDSTGLDAGSWAITPDELKEIL